MRRRIVLFTPFLPGSGGGGTVLRTLVPELADVEIRWLYTAPSDAGIANASWVGPPLAGGPPWQDLPRVLALWSGRETRGLRRVVDAVRDAGGDGFWVVAHNEGVLLADALSRLGLPVHVTVHDDVPDGIFGRSVRYRSLASFVRPVFYGALQRARSVDVISDGMCRYYRFLLGRAPIVVRPYLPASPPPAPERPATADELVVGHIGTIYDISEWRAFLGALRERARLVHRTPRMRVIGLDAKFRSLLGAEQEMVEDLGGLPEAEARRRLGECHFLYAMYPFAPTAEVFRRTSIPTKLTTYLCCELPIFAHTPLPSSLGEVVRRYDVGVVCAAPAGDALAEGIAAIIGRRPEPGAFARARAELYGRDNVDRLSAALAALTA